MSVDYIRKAVVTGASSGIGREIAKQFAREGWHVLAVARRSDRLKALADEIDGGIVPFPCDLAADSGPGDVVAAAQERIGGIELLINNAGVSWVTMMAEMADQALERRAVVAYTFYVRLIQAVVRGAAARRAWRRKFISTESR